MKGHTEETLRIVRGGIDDLDGALAWAVQALESRFAGATMVRMELEQYMVLTDEDTETHYQWSAVVSGLVGEG